MSRLGLGLGSGLGLGLGLGLRLGSGLGLGLGLTNPNPIPNPNQVRRDARQLLRDIQARSTEVRRSNKRLAQAVGRWVATAMEQSTEVRVRVRVCQGEG